MTKVAAIQMVSTDRVETNLQTAAGLIQEAASQQAEFLVLPENFPLMGMQEQDKISILEPYGNGPIQSFLGKQAQLHEVWILGGTVPLAASVPDKVRAASLLYNPEGRCVARYDKIHLFDVSVNNTDETYNESSTIEGGDELVVIRTPLGNIGLSVCYDLRFPELYRNMHAQDVNIITVPSAFTYTTGKSHWESLLRARAVENLCYVIASNQGGRHNNNRETWGHSLIMNPWGDILAVVEQGEGVACADIDLEQLQTLRTNFPTLQHRKPDYHNK
jgi:deaminated glutathione amidase